MTRLVEAMQSLSAARKLGDVQVIVRRAARELCGADGATFVLKEGDNCFYADEDAIAPLWKGSRFPMSACISGLAMTQKTSLVIPDVAADARIPADLYRPTFVKSLAMVPIGTRDPIGAIGTYWASSYTPSAFELKLLEMLADTTCTAMENVSLYARLERQVNETSDALAEVKAAAEATSREVEERKRAEHALNVTQQQLYQAQKMEAVGQLAGGIAHDFNNVLSVILSYSALLLEQLKRSEPMREIIEEMNAAGQRAAALTRQLLIFSRKQVLELRVVNMNDVLLGVESMLERLLGEDVELHFKKGPNIYAVLADPSQLEQVLMNLVVNARDAMPRGGRLTIETSNVRLDGEYTRHHLGVADGEYVMLAVSDSGLGMSRETQARIFDPFFTTKPAGRGTGLGLATVYGIVKQSGGHIWVYSEEGKGTTFRLYLPRTRAVLTHTELPAVTEKLGGEETILLVEDDAQVRAAARGILKRAGYTVLECQNAGEALLTCEQHSTRIHLLLSDVVMPQMSGPQLVQRLVSLRPDMKALCMSGYTDEAVMRHGVFETGVAFIEKPLTPIALLTKVRQVLDS